MSEMAQDSKFGNFSSKISKFFKDIRGELRKVVWPTFDQVRHNTIVVIVGIVISGIFIALLDYAFVFLISRVV